MPPRDRAVLRRFDLDLDDPGQARFFIDGVRAADELIAEESAARRCQGRPSPPR
ncbi:hypothetical protein [Sorangium sp. So ce124]|uniref:hypothetical protein n=1 Tax=Sorangium sp. So ce124 TaxID=3133280 RepID=UPI003F634C7E